MPMPDRAPCGMTRTFTGTSPDGAPTAFKGAQRCPTGTYGARKHAHRRGSQVKGEAGDVITGGLNRTR